MLKKWFGTDSSFTGTMEKLADIMILNLLWFLCSLPVVTFAASASALYYGVVKCIRRERGTVVHEFLGFFRSNWKQGIGLSAGYIVLGGLALLNIRAVTQMEAADALQVFYRVESAWVGLLFVFLSIYLFPVFSRFQYGILEGMKMSLLLSLRHIVTSLAMTAVLASAVSLILRFPVLILILPGIWMLILSFFMEKIFVRYMKKPEEGEEVPWYWEGTEEIVQDNEKKRLK